MLAIYTNNILLIPGMLILLPGFLEMRGNISGTLSARISSGLFLKVIKNESIKNKIIKGNLTASFILVIIISLCLGLLAFLFTFLIFKVLYFKIILLALLAGILANAIEIPISLFLTFYLFKKGHDPNNIMGPFVTSLGDIISVISLLIMITII